VSTRSPAPAGAPQRAQPESLRARELTASLTVKDLAKSMAWYRDVVGFTVDREIERDGKVRSVALTAGEVRILLNQDDGAKGWDRVKGAGCSLRLITVQSIDEIAGRIKAHGGTLELEPIDRPWGRLFRVRDPDGFLLVISSETPAS
jgi:predicted enzyme related to lactoylglutathione lyase